MKTKLHFTILALALSISVASAKEIRGTVTQDGKGVGGVARHRQHVRTGGDQCAGGADERWPRVGRARAWVEQPLRAVRELRRAEDEHRDVVLVVPARGRDIAGKPRQRVDLGGRPRRRAHGAGRRAQRGRGLFC